MTRQEIEEQVAQAVAGIATALVTLTLAIEGAIEMIGQETANGHEGIANIYGTAQQVLESAQQAANEAYGLAEQAQSTVAQAQGV